MSNWRPRNETSEDLQHEAEASRAITNRFGYTVTKLSEALYHIDWIITKDSEIRALGEFKKRKNSITAYPDLLLSAAKWKIGWDYADMFGVPFIMFVQWHEGLFYLKADRSSPIRYSVGGNNRGQNGDFEPLVHLKIADFIKV